MMNTSEGSAGRFHTMQRKAVRITPGAVVRYSYLDENERFPLVIEASDGRYQSRRVGGSQPRAA